MLTTLRKTWLKKRVKIITILSKYVTLTNQEKAMNLFFQFLDTSKIGGDYLEFGVYKGKTFVAAHNAAQASKRHDMRFFAFDSFQGLPTPKNIDSENDVFQEKQFEFSQDKFKKEVAGRGVDLKKCVFVPGWFDQSLNAETKKNLDIKKAAMIYVDCDLYESTVPILEFIVDYLQTGTVLAFDDWYCYAGAPDRGEQRAVAEWLQKYPHIQLMDYYNNIGCHGKAFTVYIKR